MALILIPTAVAVALGGLRIYSSAQSAASYGRVEHLAQLGSDITELVHDFAAERDLSIAYISSGRQSDQMGPVQQQYAKVDADVVRVRALLSGVDASYGSQTNASALTLRNRLDVIGTLRTIATKTLMPAPTVLNEYSESIVDLLAFNDGITQSSADANLAATARAMTDLSRAKEQASQEGGLLYEDLAGGRIGPNELSDLVSAQAQEDGEIASFQTTANPSQRQFYDDTVIGPDVDLAAGLRQRAIALGLSGGHAAAHLNIDPGTSTAHQEQEWLAADTAKINRMRTVEQSLANQVITGSQDRKTSAQRSAIISAVLVAVVLILVLLVTLMMAQSLVRPLRRLRAGALDVAGNRLPGLVRRLREPNFVESDFAVEPIDVETTDEIGEVARAFDEVHREAVRLASNEALLRGNVNAMFVNLSRRSQSLIERQIRLIDNLEQSEQDSERLDSLFKLDHLATRMRRNCENLLVLGGQEQTRRWNQPVPLVDIVRASLSEVEQYERIGLRIQGDVSVAGNAVNDLVHLVAELVENATTFSPEHTKVAVSGHLLAGGGAMLQISDNGLGMTPEELEDANWRLANPPTVDVSVSRRMGLFVVGRLAQRHGVRVELRSALSGGLTTFILLPAQLIIHGDPNAAPPRGIEEQLADGIAGLGHGGNSAFSPGAAMPSSVESKLNPIAAGARPQPLGGPSNRFGTPPETTPYNGGPVDPWDNRVPRQAEPPYPGAAEPSYPGANEPPYPGAAEPPYPGAAEPPYGGAAEPPYGTGEFPAVSAEPGSAPRGDYEPHDTPPYGSPVPPNGTVSGDPLPRRRPGESTGGPSLGGATGGSVFSEPAPADRPAASNLPPLDRAGSVGPRRPVPPARPPNPAPPGAAGSYGGRPNARPGPGGNSPIFEAMQSEWFQRRRGGPSPSTPQPPPVWNSPGDAGWEAAETIRNPTAGGHTASGLPKRVPGRNHVPGSVASTTPPQPVPVKSPDMVRDRFSNFQQGVRRGRSVAPHTEDEQETQ